MKTRISITTTPIAILLILALFASLIPGCNTPVAGATSYIAVVPGVLQSGGEEAVTVTLYNDAGLASGRVEVTLLGNGTELASAAGNIKGKGTIQFQVPDVEEGEYEISIKGEGFEDKAAVSVERSYLIFVETDKPIYKPGQTIHMRAITLDPDLKPTGEDVTIEVLDAKGIKVFRAETTTDKYGTVTLDLPVSDEPNLGVWKINANSEKDDTQLDVRVEEYVLPKYEVNVELPREWFLVSEPVEGSVSAEYSFGKPVKGELVITASRYVGQWEEYATFTKDIDGEADFEIPAAGYVAGIPAAGGLGNVMLDVTVRETSTGYEETTSELLTVSSSPVNIQIIPEGIVFKPTLPFNFLVITETPDNEPVDTDVQVTVTYYNGDLEETGKKYDETFETSNGKALVEVTPPEDAIAMEIYCFELTPDSTVQPASAFKTVEAGYSPSGNFIHVEQVSEGIPDIGEKITFKVYSTDEASRFYYEVVSRDSVVFSDYTGNDRISFDTTPGMTPSAKLLVYQILPNSEVAADYIPFKVTAEYPHDVTVEFSEGEAEPGDSVEINVHTEGESKVGIVAVDKSVFILAENRLNLQQVFAELEKLYMEPQVELHEVSIWSGIDTRGAQDVFDDAGVVVMSNNDIPEGKKYGSEWMWDRGGGMVQGGWADEDGFFANAVKGAIPEAALPPSPGHEEEGLAEVERVRQFFPETWLWEEIITGADGRGSLAVEVPDTITTWMLRAVALSPDKGLGVAEAQLLAFQPFFLSVDLPYSAIRGEEFPVSVAVYNYLDEPQSVLVEIEKEDWFELLADSQKTVEIDANDIGGVEFMIKPEELGVGDMKVTARSKEAADAVIKTLIVLPEGVSREIVENLVLSAGSTEIVNTSIPPFAVDGSGRAYLAFTSSYLTQTIEGLEKLIQMPFGCGEQNMMMFAPDAYITKYLEESGQLKPEIMAKAELLMITGYQRQLTYRHSDGSFSAFGESDESGSLFLTAFVLKCFSQAEDLIYIDDSILREAEDWITDHQNADGSFDKVGFVCHEEMMGGVEGKTALTAYVTIALLEAGEKNASAKAVDFLEGELEEIDDGYTAAITAYALELAGSGSAGDAYDKLMEFAEEDENGLHWGAIDEPLPLEGEEELMPRYPVMPNRSAVIEATGYATLALIQHGDAFNASRAAKWLVSQRNAYGGYDSTQDTVTALQALTEYATDARADVDLTISIESETEEHRVTISQDNFDVLQIVEVPVDEDIDISVEGEGEAIAQVVTRYNLPEVEETGENVFDISVEYDTTEVEVNDIVEVSVEVEFNPPLLIEGGKVKAEMVVLDISVPTGFAPVTETVAEVVEDAENIKRYEVAGRKVIFYIEDMMAGDSLSFSFDVRAQYPVKAKGVASHAYNYYQPEQNGETLSVEMVVTGG